MTWDELPPEIQAQCVESFVAGTTRIAGLRVWLRQAGYEISSGELSRGLMRAKSRS